MDFVLILLAFIASFSLVQSRETIEVLKSVKLNEKMIYDCVDIYKQPSLNHPLLKNHKIQMQPSFATSKSKNEVECETCGNVINCPNGTVPILRNTEEYVANGQYMAEKHFSPLTAESHGTHLAGVRLHKGPYHGIGARISVHDLNIGSDQISYAHIYVGTRVNNQDNYIQTGWMINQQLFGDGRPWNYGFWKGANGGACYNTVCSGFIQVSTNVPLSDPVPPGPDGKRNIAASIQQDKTSGNWWKTLLPSNIQVGYWPKELFDTMGNSGVDMVGAGGAVESSPSGQSPPMGNGHQPTKDEMESARIQDLIYINSDSVFSEANDSEVEILLDSPNCYGITRGKINKFLFGGPGGDSCGV